MKREDNGEEDRSLKAPEKLVAALRQSRPDRVFVPPTVDEAILRAARERLAPVQTTRFRWLPLPPWIVAATAVFVAIALVFVRLQPRRGDAKQSDFAKQDLNHHNRMNILDAFALARQLKQGTVSDMRLDVNGDGVVDEQDVRIIAAEAVKLDKGGHS